MKRTLINTQWYLLASRKVSNVFYGNEQIKNAREGWGDGSVWKVLSLTGMRTEVDPQNTCNVIQV